MCLAPLYKVGRLRLFIATCTVVTITLPGKPIMIIKNN